MWSVVTKVEACIRLMHKASIIEFSHWRLLDLLLHHYLIPVTRTKTRIQSCLLNIFYRGLLTYFRNEWHLLSWTLLWFRNIEWVRILLNWLCHLDLLLTVKVLSEKLRFRLFWLFVRNFGLFSWNGILHWEIRMLQYLFNCWSFTRGNSQD